MKYLSLFILIFHSGILAEPMIGGRNLGDPGYGTHMAVLVTAAMHTDGPILELGCGDYSTPLLHAICSKTERFLLSTETDQNWLKLFYDLKTAWHHFEYVPVFENSAYSQPEKWDSVGSDRHWSLVFIDHRPGERRVVDIKRLRPITDIFVVHDTEDPFYRYEAVLSTFKYRFTYQRYRITTTIVSDVIDVEKMMSL